jgi:hypothetical protein
MQVPDMDPEVLLAQFNRLLNELLRGNMNRNTFQPWEIEILLDIEACDLREANKREILRRYQKAVHREMEKGLPTPFRLSQYLEGLKARKAVQSEKREARERSTGTLN